MGRCNFYLYGPAVPGAIAPVDATEDMTNPVGIKNCRLYVDAPTGEDMTELDDRVTALENAGGGATTDYCKLSSYIETISAASTPLPLTEVLNSDSDKFAVTSSDVTIGADVNALLVSMYIASASYSIGLLGIGIYKNGNYYGGISDHIGSTSGSASLSTIVDVTEGDVLTFKYLGIASAGMVTAGISIIQIG